MGIPFCPTAKTHDFPLSRYRFIAFGVLLICAEDLLVVAGRHSGNMAIGIFGILGAIDQFFGPGFVIKGYIHGEIGDACE